MPDKALIDFIVNQKAIGAHIEKIRVDLRTNEWTDEDIDKAIAYLEVQGKKSDHRHIVVRKIIYSLGILCVLLLCSYLAFVLLNRNTAIFTEKAPDPILFPDLTPVVPKEIFEPVASSTNVVDDIQAVRKRFGEQFPDALYIRAQREGDVMIVSGSITNEFGTSTTRDYVFTKTDSVWSVDLDKTAEREINIQTQASSTIPTIPQPRVQNVKVRPSPPLVNNKDTELLVEIKNIGTVPTEEFTFTVGYDARETFETTISTAIGPDQTYIWRYKPYPLGKVYSDKKGKHTLTISIPNEEPFVQEFDLY